MLTEEEQAVYRRGRNSRTAAVPKGASVGEYHAATALESLFGWLYLQGRTDITKGGKRKGEGIEPGFLI